MKNIFTLFIFSLLAFSSLNAQKNVILDFNHLLGSNEFSFDSAHQNDMGHSFTVTRLEYYVSQIVLTHDGGTQTPVEDFYILVNMNNPGAVDLGSHDVNSIEGISFFIGVDQDNNHGDPSAWDASHPLSPKSPSMHWGWNAGYRFVAMEGKSSTNLQFDFQLHGLGDSNYFQVDMPLSATEVNDELVININADYALALSDINLNSSPISHGETGEAKSCLVNFNQKVFTPGKFVSSLNEELLDVNLMAVYPNPSLDRIIKIDINDEISKYDDLSIFNANGQLVQKINLTATSLQIELPSSGVFYVRLNSNDGKFVAKKITAL